MPDMPVMPEQTFLGYRRENRRVGVRNHVAIIPVDDISNAAVEAVSHVIQGTLPLPHAYGRLQYGDDLELFFRTMIGIGSNPNVAAAVVIGIEENWSRKIADGIAETGKPVSWFAIERYGDLKTIERASRQARDYKLWASELKRAAVDIGELSVSLKCGESDTTTGLGSCRAVGVLTESIVDSGGTVLFGETSELTGAEHIVADRAIDEEVRDQFLRTFNSYVDFIEEQAADLLGSQPTQGNIAGGLSTIEEKAMGNIQKIGSCKFVSVLEPAEAPDGPGLHFMDSSSAAAEFVTLMAAAGAVVHVFPTGQGNIVGNPVIPVIKTSANPRTVVEMSEHIDVDVSGLLRREMTLPEAGAALLEMLVRVASGRWTAAEALGHKELILTKLYRSA